MSDHTSAIIAVLAILAAFLISVPASKYMIHNNFKRTRLIMSAFFLFVVAALSISFWPYGMMTFNYSFPAILMGIILGQIIGVRTEEQKEMEQGVEYYLEHFAEIKPEDLKNLSWWSIVNFYSIMCGLVLINLIGFTNIILKGSPAFIIATSSIGAFFVGTIVPYLIHLWAHPVRERLNNRKNEREQQ